MSRSNICDRLYDICHRTCTVSYTHLKSFDFFQNQFENVGKNLNKAQEAFETAQRHLKSYRGKVSALSGQEQLELESSAPVDKPLSLIDKAGIDKASA